MARTWTTEQASSLAPDAAALKAGQGLGSPRKWTGLGGDGDFIWGLAQGSGANPYQVQIDLSEPAFKCSCPSRKFPCKHGLGLLLLFAAQPSVLPAAARPEWVNEWVAKRAQKVAKQEAKAAEPAEAPDPAAQAKRREKREGHIGQGVEFVEGWLRDLARQGLAAAGTAGYDFWDTPARRLIDAQAPGLARRVRELGAAIASGHPPEAAGLLELGRLHVVVSAYQRRDALPPAWQDELAAQVGFTTEQHDLRQREGVAGTWFVGAQTAREEEKIIMRTTYLFSTAGRVAKLLEFSPAARPALASLALGRWVEGELVYFPGVDSRRALWKTPPKDATGGELELHHECATLFAAHAASLALNPLADPLPALVQLVPVHHVGGWWLRDATGAALPLHPSVKFGWELLACSGGEPLDLIGLWDGQTFLPLTALAPEGLLQLSSRVG